MLVGVGILLLDLSDMADRASTFCLATTARAGEDGRGFEKSDTDVFVDGNRALATGRFENVTLRGSISFFGCGEETRLGLAGA